MGERYDQCDTTCTVDCGHCKGQGRTVATAIHGASRQCVLGLDECLAEGEHRRETRAVLTALADAGILTEPRPGQGGPGAAAARAAAILHAVDHYHRRRGFAPRIAENELVVRLNQLGAEP
jgi:hypothetical protein